MIKLKQRDRERHKTNKGEVVHLLKNYKHLCTEKDREFDEELLLQKIFKKEDNIITNTNKKTKVKTAFTTNFTQTEEVLVGIGKNSNVPFQTSNFDYKYNPSDAKNTFKISLKTNLINQSPNSIERDLTKETKIVYALIVDDEYMIRNAMKRLITNQLSKEKNLEVVIIEANDGIECLLAIYLANINQIKIDFVITDENMNYINGTYSSEIIKTLIKSGKFQDIPIFMSTALGKNIVDSKPHIINKVFSKPMDKNSIRELLMICGILNK